LERAVVPLRAFSSQQSAISFLLLLTADGW
jgi:hypothetical protein